MLRICVFFLPKRLTAFTLCVFNVFTLVLVNVVLTALLIKQIFILPLTLCQLAAWFGGNSSFFGVKRSAIGILVLISCVTLFVNLDEPSFLCLLLVCLLF